MRTVSIVMVAMFVANFATAQVKELTVKSKISHVTLYRSQAMISREVVVDKETGELAILIENLPSSVDPTSLFATSDNLQIRSVRYFTEYIKIEKDDSETGKITELEKRIKDLEVQKQKINPERTLLASKKRFIEQLEKKYISQLGPSTTPLTDKAVKVSGFDFTTIEQMTDFIFKRQQEITTHSMALDDKLRKYDDDISKVREELNAIYHGSSVAMDNNASVDQSGQFEQQPRKVIRKAIVYAAKKNAKSAKLTLNYLVSNTGWSPSYNMRIAGNSDSLGIEYLAHVRQLSGEDWDSVTLTLSNATPNMNAEIPILGPMWTRLVATGEAAKKESYFDGASNLMLKNRAKQDVMNHSFQKKAKANYKDYNYAVNFNANDQQFLEFVNPKQVLKKWYSEMKKSGQQIAVEYRIPDTITLASRKDNQMVPILSTSLSCNLYYEAVPLLANYVSRGIEAQNTMDQPLLGGQYSAFIDGQYVGKGRIPLTVTGETLALGFGVDPQLKCSRELIDKTGDKSWGSRIETYSYKLTIDNFKSKPVSVRLIDRIPKTKDKGLKITLTTAKEKISKDIEYVKFDYPKGILRWDMELPASTSGSNATAIDYSFDMKFDSDMQISTKGKEIKLQMQNDLQESRMRKFRF